MTTQAQLTQVARILNSSSSQRQQMADRVKLMLRSEWGSAVSSYGGIRVAYDEQAIQSLIASWVSISRSGQSQAALSNAAFLRLIRNISGDGIRVQDTSKVPQNLRGVPDEEVYERPLKSLRFFLYKGDSDEEASSKALLRLDKIVDADLQLAERFTSQKILSSVSTIIGYRRVLRPELSKTGSCGLCIAASDRIYKTQELLPIHHECKCKIMEVTKDFDPGRFLNANDLQALYDAAGGTQRAELKKFKAKVVQHGELGPILVNESHNWRTEFEAREDTRNS